MPDTIDGIYAVHITCPVEYVLKSPQDSSLLPVLFQSRVSFYP